jgi:uncharacterized SAM-binding protein YcdF (DUF218 family)
MSIFLSKFLPILIYPLGLSCLLALLALFLRRKQRWQLSLIIVAMVILWLGGNKWISTSLARSLEWRYLPPEVTPNAEVIVVLGGGTEPAQYPRSAVEANSAVDRVLHAGRLYDQGKSAHILLSGGYISWLEPGDGSPAAEMAELLVMMGVPEDALWLEEESLNTYENAVNSAGILAENGIGEILLVTSALHMPRAVALFEHQGLTVIPAPADFTVTETGWKNLVSGDIQKNFLYLFPNASSLSLTTNVMKEYLGMLFYKLRGWI